MNKYSAGILALALIFVTAIACQRAENPPPEVLIGHAPHDHHAPLYIAAQKGAYFKQHGGIYLKEIAFRKQYDLIADGQQLARVSIDSSVGGQKVVRRLVEGHFDLVLGGFPAMLSYIDQGEPIKILAPIMTEGAELLLSKELQVHSWQEFVALVDKRSEPVRIGYKMNLSVQNLIFEQALKAAGITYNDNMGNANAKVRLVNLSGAQNLIPALQNGLVDGLVIMQPYVAMAESQGVGQSVSLPHDLTSGGKWTGYPCCALAGSNDFVRFRPKVAEAIVMLILQANKYILEHPEECAGLVSRWLDTPPGVEAKSLPTICFTAEMDRGWQNGAEKWAESMLKDGLLTGKVKEAYQAGKLKEVIYDLDLYNRVTGRM